MNSKLIEQKEKAILKSHEYDIEGKFILAAYWKKKIKKFSNMEKKSIALVKRQLASEGIKRLNTIKI